RSRTAREPQAAAAAVRLRLRGLRLPGEPHRGGAAACGRGADRVAVRADRPAVWRGVRLQRGRVVAQYGGRAEPPAVLADLRDYRCWLLAQLHDADGQRGGRAVQDRGGRAVAGPAPGSGLRRDLPDAPHAGHAAQLPHGGGARGPAAPAVPGDPREPGARLRRAGGARPVVVDRPPIRRARATVGLVAPGPAARPPGASPRAETGYPDPNGRADHRVLSPPSPAVCPGCGTRIPQPLDLHV